MAIDLESLIRNPKQDGFTQLIVEPDSRQLLAEWYQARENLEDTQSKSPEFIAATIVLHGVKNVKNLLTREMCLAHNALCLKALAARATPGEFKPYVHDRSKNLGSPELSVLFEKIYSQNTEGTPLWHELEDNDRDEIWSTFLINERFEAAKKWVHRELRGLEGPDMHGYTFWQYMFFAGKIDELKAEMSTGNFNPNRFYEYNNFPMNFGMHLAYLGLIDELAQAIEAGIVDPDVRNQDQWNIYTFAVTNAIFDEAPRIRQLKKFLFLTQVFQFDHLAELQRIKPFAPEDEGLKSLIKALALDIEADQPSLDGIFPIDALVLINRKLNELEDRATQKKWRKLLEPMLIEEFSQPVSQQSVELATFMFTTSKLHPEIKEIVSIFEYEQLKNFLLSLQAQAFHEEHNLQSSGDPMKFYGRNTVLLRELAVAYLGPSGTSSDPVLLPVIVALVRNKKDLDEASQESLSSYFGRNRVKYIEDNPHKSVREIMDYMNSKAATITHAIRRYKPEDPTPKPKRRRLSN